MSNEELQSLYNLMDKFLEKLIEKKENEKIIGWDKVDNATLDKLEIPKGDLVEEITSTYSTSLVSNNSKTQYFVIGEYRRRDFYNEQNYDTENEIFITVYQIDNNDPEYFGKGKIYMTENLYKNFLLANKVDSSTILYKLNYLLKLYREASLQNSDELFD